MNPYQQRPSTLSRWRSQHLLLLLLLAIGCFVYVVYDDTLMVPNTGQGEQQHRTLRAQLLRTQASLTAAQAQLDETMQRAATVHARDDHLAAAAAAASGSALLRAELAGLQRAAQRSAAEAKAAVHATASSLLVREAAESKRAMLRAQLSVVRAHDIETGQQLRVLKARMNSAAITTATAATAAPAGVAAAASGEGATAAVAASTGATATTKVKFLLWDLDPPNYGERFSTRKRYAVRSFFLAQHLAKAEVDGATGVTWVLVLPPFPASFDGTKNYVRWDALFDVPRLRRAYPHIMEFEEWAAGATVEQGRRVAPGKSKELHTELTAAATPQRSLDMLVPLEDKIGSFDSSVEQAEPLHWDACEKGSLAYGLTDEAGGRATIFGKEVTVRQIRCASTRQAMRAAQKAMKAPGAQSVLLTRFFCPDIAGEDWEIWQHMRPSALILREVSEQLAACCPARRIRAPLA